MNEERLTIAYCQATWKEDFEKTEDCLGRMMAHADIDHIILVYDQTMTAEQKKKIAAWTKNYKKGHAVFNKFKDNMPEMRNAYLKKAKELGVDWCIVSDPDELFSVEFAKTIRNEIERAHEAGYNMLPVHAKDQFENVDWLDELDLLKESPGGYRETDFWKPLLVFRLYPDVHYEGVGIEKNVHETLVTANSWRKKNLPRKMYYVHRKSAFRIWRNAARNMFIGGGGNNVGETNPLWKPLKVICAKHKVNSWPEFEEFIREGKGINNPEFENWLKKALQAPPTNWGTETRETAKWFYALHMDQVTDEIQNLIDNPPEMTPEIRAKNIVRSAYFRVLGRPPDNDGLEHYTKAILEHGIGEDEVIESLMQSYEFAQMSNTQEREDVKVKVPVDVTVQVNEDTFIDALRSSDTYWRKIKPKIDLGGLFLRRLKRTNKEKFIRWYYENIDELEPQDIASYVIENFPKPDSLAVCIMGYSDVVDMISRSIKIMAEKCQNVTEFHITGDDFTDKDKKQMIGATLGEAPIYFHNVPWTDDFSDYKNKAIHPANTEWVLILDHDEIPTEDMASVIPELIEHSGRGRKYNIVQFNVIDQITENGEVIRENKSDSGKALLHWNVDDAYYGNPHIWMKPRHYPWSAAKAPTSYYHVKEEGSILPRSVRNIFLGGGGDNSKEDNPLWVKLRKKTKELGIDTWESFHNYLKEGNISEEIYLILEEMFNADWKDDELKHPLRYYKRLHPEEFGEPQTD